MNSPMGRWVRFGSAAVAFALLALPSTWAKWMHPEDIPVSRLLKNVRGYIAAHPKDPHGYYTLGRINSAAFALDTENIGVYTHDGLPSLPTHPNLSPPARDKTKPLSPQALTYLSDAVSNYKKAISLDATDGLAWLGLGFQCEEALPYPQAIGKASAALGLAGKPDAERLRQEALRNDRKAYALTVKTDTTRSMGLDNPVSLEAAQGIVRLQQNHRLSPSEQAELDEMQKQIAAFQSKPRPMTPILISFDRQATMSDLLAPEKHVRFDLAGDGLGRQWPWVKPTTGILVWDPKHMGKITSGLQLFGDVTWWLFWKDGYEPLAALDNNHNGWLEGAELQGIAVWFDRNGNGIADPGEVVSLTSLGIKRIAVHSAGMTDGVPANPNGIQLRDGSSLPTFDWTPTSLSTRTRASDATIILR
jgi:hypothetical protein